MNAKARAVKLRWAAIVALVAVGCRTPAPETPPTRAEGDNPLLVGVDAALASNAKLLARVRATPHGYFRLVNVQFSQHVCALFARDGAPHRSFNLHGDAHIEQYAVTTHARGLTDFDDSSTGPATLDLMRMAVSLGLTCRARKSPGCFKAALDALLRGYRRGLDKPESIPAEPSLATRHRGKFTEDRSKFLAWTEKIVDAAPADEMTALHAAMKPYRAALISSAGDVDAAYLQQIKSGRLRLGIGSARDLKYLLRVRGKTDAPDDDVILEVKEVRDISSIPCVAKATAKTPLRVLLGQVRIAYRPFRHLGYFAFRGRRFWVHGWADNYTELKHDRDFAVLADLSEVAADIGVQLGRGHCNQVAGPFGRQLRAQHRAYIDRIEPKIRRAAVDLTKLTVDAWQAFGRAADKRSAPAADARSTASGPATG